MQKKRIRHTGARVGDLRERVLIEDRSIASPLGGMVDFLELFESDAIWAGVSDVSGKTVFDGVGTEVDITHKIYIRHRVGVDSQSFLQLDDGRRLKVVAFKNLGERNEYMALYCSDRGVDQASYL